MKKLPKLEKMVRKSVYLTVINIAKIKQVAKKQKITESAVIRELIHFL